MNFIQKLIQDTNNGMWDYYWKYSEGSDSYTFNKVKHYLTGLTFSLIKDKTLIIFPNGYGMRYSEELMKQLRDTIDISLERTVDDSIKTYISGQELTSQQQDEIQSTSGSPNNTKPKEEIKSGSAIDTKQIEKNTIK